MDRQPWFKLITSAMDVNSSESSAQKASAHRFKKSGENTAGVALVSFSSQRIEKFQREVTKPRKRSFQSQGIRKLQIFDSSLAGRDPALAGPPAERRANFAVGISKPGVLQPAGISEREL